MSALWPVQTALYARLSAALPGVAVYDGEAPQGAPGPYVVIGERTEGEQSFMQQTGWNQTVMLHIWERAQTSAGVLALLEQINAALKTELDVPGFWAARLRYEFGTPLVDGGWRHVPARYRIHALETV